MALLTCAPKCCGRCRRIRAGRGAKTAKREAHNLILVTTWLDEQLTLDKIRSSKTVMIAALGCLYAGQPKVRMTEYRLTATTFALIPYCIKVESATKAHL